MFFRFIIYSILFWIVLKAAAIVWEYFKRLSEKNNPSVKGSTKRDHNINKRDIIDAEFEDITEKEKKD